jgi:hypothetical protein
MHLNIRNVRKGTWHLRKSRLTVGFNVLRLLGLTVYDRSASPFCDHRMTASAQIFDAI